MRKASHLVLLLVTSLLVMAFISEVSPQLPQGDPTPGASGVGDPYFPELGNGGYDAQHYTLDIDVNMETNVIVSTVTMQARATQFLSSFNLDFAGFDILSVLVDGNPADFERNLRELVITPTAPIGDEALFETQIIYTGVPGRNVDLARSPFAGGWTRYNLGVYVASEPDGASLWYPVNDHPSDKATYTIIITVAKPYSVAANGTLLGIADEGEQRTYTWQSRDPIASYLVTVNISYFERHDDTVVEGVPIRNYFPNVNYRRGQEVFSDQADMMMLFNDAFSAYPFEAYGSVVANTSLPFALETQTLSLYGNNILQGGTGASITIAHEMVHAWFGDSVSPATWRDIWLNEGFATYGSALWLEQYIGVDETERILNEWYDAMQNRPLIIGDPGAQNLFASPVYYKGAWTLHALRLRLGDDTFFNILHSYQGQYANSNAEIADFIAIAEEVSGQDLGTFFDAWLYQPNIPPRP
ncbi:MAG: M1 family metallopeptidase [Anaerolineae bacterium]|nr:M1 family metallopeptidase [Anaerolineae bacterium]